MERDIQKSILNGLHLLGIQAFRMNSGTFVNKETNTWIQGHAPGTPDIMVCYPRGTDYLVGWIEVKTEKTKLNWAQVKFLKEVNAKRIPWLVARCWEDVDTWLHDPSYHGEDDVTAPVIDKDYVHVWRRPRNVNKPNPYQPLIDERNARIKKQEEERGEVPF